MKVNWKEFDDGLMRMCLVLGVVFLISGISSLLKMPKEFKGGVYKAYLDNANEIDNLKKYIQFLEQRIDVQGYINEQEFRKQYGNL